ncbi:polysaccharide biosynthesis tyrosine autokinase [Microcoleus sp. FACHB-1515]|uniref:GumC family protein n=1 Tax=Cyanophyceae TaxID=3028117 RepID=UPI0016858FDD|nr:polysaccharide biosynthesis tyrosine autokinase [Microcoleus sp. FACHB-1515]MBD2089094.1 polysaccharide biosynthesis tyrosine autokinase [Microcoleus sp. FACHB-1515]
MGKVHPALATLSASRRHYWAGLAVFAAVLGTATAILSTASSRYETSARLIVQDNRASISDLGQRLTTAEPPRDVNPIATQAELVTSQRVIQRAIESLQQKGEISSEALPSASEIRGDVSVKIVPATSILDLTYQHSDPEIAASVLNAIAESMVIENTQAIRSEASSVREFLEKQIPVLQANLRQAEINERNYRRDNSLVLPDVQVESLVTSLTALEQEKGKLVAQLQELGTRNSLLQQVTSVNAPETAYSAVRVGQDEQLQNLQGQLTALDAEIADRRSRLGDQHPDLLAALDKREELQALYDQRLASLSSQGNSAASGNSASNELSQKLLSDYIESDINRRALVDRLRVVQAEVARLQSRVAQVPVLQQPLTALVRSREEAASTLAQAQAKFQEAQIAEAQLTGSIQIVGAAEVPTSPVSPKAPVILVMAIAVGTVLGIGVVLLLEVANVALQTSEEVEERLKLPVLGVLPKMPAKLEVKQFLDNPDFVEPYRALLKNLESQSAPQLSVLEPEYSTATVNTNNHFSAQGKASGQLSKQARVIVISSTIDEEGKSQVGLFLAAVGAMLSRRTLLIDVDSRSPVQHHLLDLPKYPGLTEVIGEHTPLAQAVQSTEVEGLSLLAYGHTIDRPSTLTESKLMKKLLNDARADYDLIILDAPPVSTCADAATLSQLADGLVLVVRPNFTPRQVAEQAISDLQKRNAPVLGTVLNSTISATEKASTPRLRSAALR